LAGVALAEMARRRCRQSRYRHGCPDLRTRCGPRHGAAAFGGVWRVEYLCGPRSLG